MGDFEFAIAVGCLVLLIAVPLWRGRRRKPRAGIPHVGPTFVGYTKVRASSWNIRRRQKWKDVNWRR